MSRDIISVTLELLSAPGIKNYSLEDNSDVVSYLKSQLQDEDGVILVGAVEVTDWKTGEKGEKKDGSKTT